MTDTHTVPGFVLLQIQKLFECATRDDVISCMNAACVCPCVIVAYLKLYWEIGTMLCLDELVQNPQT